MRSEFMPHHGLVEPTGPVEVHTVLDNARENAADNEVAEPVVKVKAADAMLYSASRIRCNCLSPCRAHRRRCRTGLTPVQNCSPFQTSALEALMRVFSLPLLLRQCLARIRRRRTLLGYSG
jgi:hypothetical protein